MFERERYRATVFATEYPGGVTWEWGARSRDDAMSDAAKWIVEEFADPANVVVIGPVRV